MPIDQPLTGVQLFSLVKPSGELELSLRQVTVAPPGADEVTVRMEAAPLNPSDLWLMFGTADLSAIRSSGTPDHPVATAPIPDAAMRAMAAGARGAWRRRRRGWRRSRHGGMTDGARRGGGTGRERERGEGGARR